MGMRRDGGQKYKLFEFRVTGLVEVSGVQVGRARTNEFPAQESYPILSYPGKNLKLYYINSGTCVSTTRNDMSRRNLLPLIMSAKSG